MWCNEYTLYWGFRFVDHLILIEKKSSYALIISSLERFEKTWFTVLGIVNWSTGSWVVKVIVLCKLMIKTQTLPKFCWLFTFSTIKTFRRGFGRSCTGINSQNFAPKEFKCRLLCKPKVWLLWRNITALLDSFE